MPTLLIYFNLPCGSFPLLTHRTCLPGFLLFSPQFYISFLHDGFVSPNILFSRYFTSLLPAFPCYPQLYTFFSSQRSVPSSRAALLNPIYHIIRHIYSFTFTHSHHRSRFFPFSFHYNLPAPHSHCTGIPIPVIYNAHTKNIAQVQTSTKPCT